MNAFLLMAARPSTSREFEAPAQEHSQYINAVVMSLLFDKVRSHFTRVLKASGKKSFEAIAAYCPMLASLDVADVSRKLSDDLIDATAVGCPLPDRHG